MEPSLCWSNTALVAVPAVAAAAAAATAATAATAAAMDLFRVQQRYKSGDYDESVRLLS